MHSVRTIEITDKLYPNILRKIKNPPKKLYVIGNIELLQEKYKKIAIVGSRMCTEYGKNQSFKFANELSKKGICIISGMAEGIDTFAHMGAVEEKGKTIAILGDGFNKIFPKENEWLFHKIINKGGCVISEYEENEEAESDNFPHRNRIVSGLSNGVLIIEAKQKSGSLITARIAKEQGKIVYALPSNIDTKNGIGTNNLILNGAKMIININSILKDLGQIENVKVENKEIKEEYKPIYNMLLNTPIHINEIVKKTKMSISEVSTILTMLELDGLIEQLPGNEFKIKE